MKNNLFKKVTALALSLTMVVGTVNVISAAHAKNGANVASKGTWTSFSVCTREDGGKWEDALKKVKNEKGQYFKKTIDYWTEGEIDKTTATSSGFTMNVVNTGWEGQYGKVWNAATKSFDEELKGDNEWTMTAQMANIPIEKGRKYTVSFDIKSTLSVEIKDENDEPTGEFYEKKKIRLKAYRPTTKGDNPGIDILTISGASYDGIFEISSGETKHIEFTVQIPNTKDYEGNYMGVQLAFGTFLYSRPNEVGMSGDVSVSNFKVIAGNQYTVTYNNAGKKTYAYVNPGAKAVKKALAKKKYTLVGYKNAATGATYNFNSAVNSDLELIPVWKKTAKPGKPTITAKSTGKKKVKITIKKKAKNTAGYQIQYSLNKKFKSAKKYKTKAKIKTTVEKSYTIKKLTSKKIWYVRVRAYTKDSAGNKIYGKYSSKKAVYVK